MAANGREFGDRPASLDPVEEALTKVREFVSHKAPFGSLSHAYLGFATPIFQSEMRRIADMLQIRQKKCE